jgi:hypothetical protein
MAAVHDLLAFKGKQGAIEAGFDRSVVEIAAAYLSDEDSGLGFAYSGWAQCALPHKRLPNDAAWGIAAEKVRLMRVQIFRPVAGEPAPLASLFVPAAAAPPGAGRAAAGGTLGFFYS